MSGCGESRAIAGNRLRTPLTNAQLVRNLRGISRKAVKFTRLASDVGDTGLRCPFGY